MFEIDELTKKAGKEQSETEENTLNPSYNTDLYGSYLMVVQLAAPPQTIHALADTGNDLVWARCKSFNGAGGPVLNLKTSLSYKPIRCLSSQCRALGCDAHCSKTRCRFQYGYSDGSNMQETFCRTLSQ
ncbi:hypothetical protein O6H91_06G074600 [Diphasiastrum complanatum]|uniref:Uncharacterized protein n=1 Tax=Diphasiastrum complanatum TaxID=34168 RepID=A0ACC2DFX8_DIPCM|nr:hypothetical protein O6H91_06G074600 [Diphasiastrum complanatum]